MKVQDPIPHWNNFTVPDLKEILKHCRALERLGIAQDEKMVSSIERDIALRDEKIGRRHVHFEPTHTRMGHIKSNKIMRTTAPHTKQQSQDYLLAENV